MSHRYLQALLDRLPAIKAEHSMMLAEAAMFPHISQKDRVKKYSVWQQIMDGAEKIIHDIHEAILMGTATIEDMERLLPKGSVVAHSFEEAHRFMA